MSLEDAEHILLSPDATEKTRRAAIAVAYLKGKEAVAILIETLERDDTAKALVARLRKMLDEATEGK